MELIGEHTGIVHYKLGQTVTGAVWWMRMEVMRTIDFELAHEE